MGKISGVHHICLKTAGRKAWEEAVAFYTRTLGCPLVYAWGEEDGSGAMLDLGNCFLEVMANGRDHLEPGVHRHVAFRTDDVDSMLELVRQAGCAVILEPEDKTLGPDHPIRVAFCRGPAGETIEFFHER